MKKKISLDLSNMKHVKTSKNHTTLQHPDGHTITLAHAALDPVNQQQLSALSKISQDAATPSQQDELKHKMAEGGQVGQSTDNSTVCNDSNDSSHGESASQSKEVRNGAKAPTSKGQTAYAEGGQVAEPMEQTVPEKAMAMAKIDPSLVDETYNMAGGAMGGIKNIAPSAEAIAAKSMTNLPGLIDQASAHAQELAAELGDYHPLVQKAYKQLNSLKDFGNNFKSSQNFASGGDVEQQPPEALQADPTPAQPDIAAVPTELTPNEQPQANPADELFNQYYNTVKQNAPKGTPDAWLRDSAYQAMDHKNKVERSKLEDTQNSMQTAQNEVNQENQRRANLGLDPLETPQEHVDQAVGAGSKLPSEQQPMGAMPAAPQDQGLAAHQPAGPSLNGDMSTGDPAGLMQQGYQNQLKGINDQAAAVGEQAKAQQEALQRDEQAKTVAQEQYKKDYSELEAERQNHIQDIKDGYVDPNKYWNNHSKIASGIGMILAGFNPTSNPNAAINFLKFQMEQDLHAQERNLGAKENLLSANLKQFGNLRDAREMTRIMQADMLTNQLQQAAAHAASPMAKAAAEQAAGHLQQEVAPMFMKFTAMRTIQQLANGNASPDAVGHALGYLRVVAPDQAKEIEGRYVPGVGMASIPLSPEVRTKIEGHQKMNVAVDDLLNFVQSHKNLVPGSPEYNVAKQKVQALQSGIRENVFGTVYKQGEQPLLDRMVDVNPIGLLNNIKAIPQLQELKAMNQRQFGTLANSVGLQQHGEQSQQVSTPTPPKGYTVQTINGKQYYVPTKGK